MLVLTRKIGERIIIGDSIILTVLHCKVGLVKLGIEAPREVPILRDELKPHEQVAICDAGISMDLLA